MASGGAPTPPGCVAANHARGRRTGRGRELPAAVQDGDAANLHRIPSFVPLSRRLMTAPLGGRGDRNIVRSMRNVNGGISSQHHNSYLGIGRRWRKRCAGFFKYVRLPFSHFWHLRQILLPQHSVQNMRTDQHYVASVRVKPAARRCRESRFPAFRFKPVRRRRLLFVSRPMRGRPPSMAVGAVLSAMIVDRH